MPPQGTCVLLFVKETHLPGQGRAVSGSAGVSLTFTQSRQWRT